MYHLTIKHLNDNLTIRLKDQRSTSLLYNISQNGSPRLNLIETPQTHAIRFKGKGSLSIDHWMMVTCTRLKHIFIIIKDLQSSALLLFSSENWHQNNGR
jgi:hypothetical protein